MKINQRKLFVIAMASIACVKVTLAQYYNYSDDISTGIDIDYNGVEEVFVTYGAGTLTNESNGVPLHVQAYSNEATHVLVGYTGGGIISDPTFVNSNTDGVVIDVVSFLEVLNAANITAAGEAIHFSVSSSNSDSYFFNDAQGNIIGYQTGVYLNQHSGNAVINFQNEGYIGTYFSSGSSPYSAVLFDNGGDPSTGNFIAVNNGTIEAKDGAYGMYNAGNATNRIEITNSGNITVEGNSAIYIDNTVNFVNITNDGNITSDALIGVNVDGAGEVNFTNTGTINGAVYITNVGNAYIKNSGSVVGNLSFELSGNNITFEMMSGSAMTGAFTMNGSNNRIIVHGGAGKSDGALDFAPGTIYEFIIADKDTSGALLSTQDITIAGSLILNLDTATLNSGDILTLVSTDSEIGGIFTNHADDEIFLEGIYEFQIKYSITDITLTVLNVIPEPSYALIFGIATFGLITTRRRRK